MGIKKLKTFKRINELEEGETIVTFFLVDSLDIRKKSDGSDYLAIRLKDRTGTVDAKIWENVQRFSELKEGDVVKIEAEVRSYRGKADLRILRMRLLEDRDYEDGFDMKWIEEWSDYDIEELWSRLKQMTDLIDSEAIRRLVHAVLGAKETVF